MPFMRHDHPHSDAISVVALATGTNGHRIATATPDQNARLAILAARYRQHAAAALDDGDELLHLVFDPDMPGEGRRFVMVAEETPLARIVQAANGRPLSYLHGLLIIGPGFLEWAVDQSDERIAELVASDLSCLLERLYPVRVAGGGLEEMTPHLARLVGDIIFSSERALDAEARATHVDRCIGRAYMAISQGRDRDGWNMGCLATDLPLWPPLVQSVADGATRIAVATGRPLALEDAGRILWSVLADAMRCNGIRIAP